MSRASSDSAPPFAPEHSDESWTPPLSPQPSPHGSGTRSDAPCAAASEAPSCPLPGSHPQRSSMVPTSVFLSPVFCVLPALRFAPPHAPSAGESPTSWQFHGSFHHPARTPAGSARIAPPWLSCPPVLPWGD